MKIRHCLPPLCAAFAATLLALSCGSDDPITTPPTPTAPPTQAPPAPPVGACVLGMGSVETHCEEGASQLLRHIETAIDLLVREHPGIVDQGSEAPPWNSGQYKVLDAERYLDTMVENLRRQQLCAERDGDDLGMKRIVVKNSNAYSEVFSVLSENGFIRRGPAAYLRTCSPASFPIQRTGDMPPAGSGCGRPYPPPITRFNCKVHLFAPEYYTVDSTPIVGPNMEYCATVGFTDGRSLCPVRPEGAEDRIACENWSVGRASDTGRYGPTWTNGDGAFCTGSESNCLNHPDNQYSVLVYQTGWVKARAENGAECRVLVER